MRSVQGMSAMYTTEDLIQILAAEQRACVTGQRLNLRTATDGMSPLITHFLNTEGLQKFTAYEEFRQTIHQYQLDHQVSGVVWRRVDLQGQVLHYPTIHDQLIALPNDRRLLQEFQDKILKFWQRATKGWDLYLSVNMGRDHQPIQALDVDRIAQRTEWAMLMVHGREISQEITLQLGWGEPREATGRRGFPKAGSELICAVKPGRRPIVG